MKYDITVSTIDSSGDRVIHIRETGIPYNALRGYEILWLKHINEASACSIWDRYSAIVVEKTTREPGHRTQTTETYYDPEITTRDMTDLIYNSDNGML